VIHRLEVFSQESREFLALLLPKIAQIFGVPRYALIWENTWLPFS